jgi:hypothetical protein
VNTDSENSDPENGHGTSFSDKQPGMQGKPRPNDAVDNAVEAARDMAFPRRARQEDSHESVRSKKQLLI